MLQRVSFCFLISLGARRGNLQNHRNNKTPYTLCDPNRLERGQSLPWQCCINPLTLTNIKYFPNTCTKCNSHEKWNYNYIVTRCTRKLIEGCLRRRLWTNAIMINAPEGGTKSASLLSLLQKEAAKYAGRSGDFKQESTSCRKNWKLIEARISLNYLCTQTRSENLPPFFFALKMFHPQKN